MSAKNGGEFDYVIVGAGAAGSVLARRLSEDPDTRVLVLEAGGAGLPTNVDVAPLWFTLLGSSVDRGYRSVPQPGLAGRTTGEPRGKGPGGTSNLYIMMHVRGAPADYDAWAYDGAAGWAWRDVAGYFDRIDGVQAPVDASQGDPNPTSLAFLDACAELGYPRLPSVNGPSMFGAAWHQLDVVDGRRRGALHTYLEPVLTRPNLTLRTSATALRLLTEDGHCFGVEYRQDADPGLPEGGGRLIASAPAGEPGVYRVRAGADVIVCCGAIDSPKLLLLSGIGPADELRALGLPVVADVPGVGRNFHNHVLTGVVAQTTEAVAAGRQNLSESALFTGSAPGSLAPDLQLAFVHVPFALIVGDGTPDAVSILPGVVRPRSRGTVRLASTDPADPPLVDPNYLGDRSDLDRLVEGVKLGREIFATAAFRPWIKQELAPGEDCRTDAELAAFVRRTADSYHHQAGSCRMGTDDLAVVDPQLRVRGVTGVRIADASVMPAVPSGNCHTAILMIGERAADLLKEAHDG